MIDSPDSIVESIDNYIKDCKWKAEDVDVTVKRTWLNSRPQSLSSLSESVAVA